MGGGVWGIPLVAAGPRTGFRIRSRTKPRLVFGQAPGSVPRAGPRNGLHKPAFGRLARGRPSDRIRADNPRTGPPQRERERERERERGERERERESQWLSNVGRMPSPDDRLHTQRDPVCTKKVNPYCLTASLDDVVPTSKAVGVVFCSPAQSFTLPPDPVFVSDDVLVLI